MSSPADWRAIEQAPLVQAGRLRQAPSRLAAALALTAAMACARPVASPAPRTTSAPPSTSRPSTGVAQAPPTLKPSSKEVRGGDPGPDTMPTDCVASEDQLQGASRLISETPVDNAGKGAEVALAQLVNPLPGVPGCEAGRYYGLSYLPGLPGDKQVTLAVVLSNGSFTMSTRSNPEGAYLNALVTHLITRANDTCASVKIAVQGVVIKQGPCV